MPELLAALVRQATKTATVRQIGSVSNITVFSYGPETPPKPPPEKKYSSSPTQADAFLWLCGRVVLD